MSWISSYCAYPTTKPAKEIINAKYYVSSYQVVKEVTGSFWGIPVASLCVDIIVDSVNPIHCVGPCI
jgi:hypothetical protein